MTDYTRRALHDARSCSEPHLRLTLEPTVSEAFAGRHLRTQREIGGFSIRALAAATNLSPTRIAQIEAASRVTPSSATRYLDGVVQAWRTRAAEAALAERQPARNGDDTRKLVAP